MQISAEGSSGSAELHRGAVASEIDQTVPAGHVGVDVLDSKMRGQHDRGGGVRPKNRNRHLRGVLGRPAKEPCNRSHRVRLASRPDRAEIRTRRTVFGVIGQPAVAIADDLSSMTCGKPTRVGGTQEVKILRSVPTRSGAIEAAERDRKSTRLNSVTL